MIDPYDMPEDAAAGPTSPPSLQTDSAEDIVRELASLSPSLNDHDAMEDLVVRARRLLDVVRPGQEPKPPRLSTYLYRKVVSDITAYVESTLSETSVLRAVREFLGTQGFDYGLLDPHVVEEAETARKNLAAAWVNLLDPQATKEDRRDEVIGLSCALALSPDQIVGFFTFFDSKICGSDRDLMRSILWN